MLLRTDEDGSVAGGEAGGNASDLLRAVRLLETCPASLLKRTGLYDKPYKQVVSPALQGEQTAIPFLPSLCRPDPAPQEPTGFASLAHPCNSSIIHAARDLRVASRRC